MLVYVLGMLPATVGMSMLIVDSVRSGVDLTIHLDVLAALISAFLALDMFVAFRGFTAFDYEQSLIFTSPVTPRSYLIASIVSEITVYSLTFIFPLFVFFGIVIASLGLSAIVTLTMLSSLLAFIFFIFFLENSLSIAESLYQGSKVRTIAVIAVVLLLFPATALLNFSPVRYAALPYPSTFLATVILESIYNRLPSLNSFVGLDLYVLASLAFFIFASGKNLFQFATAVPFVSPFDTSMKMQSAKMDKNIKFFSRLGLRVSLSLKSESLLMFLMKKEFIRMIRDGSLFGVLFLYLIVSVMSVAGRTAEIPFPLWMTILATYSFIVPVMLISNWRIGELKTFWIPLTSAADFDCVIKALLYDLTLIALVVPALSITVLTFIGQIDPLTPLVLVTSVSTVGCASNLFATMYFLGKKRRATPSFMIIWASMLLSGLLISPAYAYAAASLLLKLDFVTRLLLAIPLLAYSAFIFWFLSGRLVEKAFAAEI